MEIQLQIQDMQLTTHGGTKMLKIIDKQTKLFLRDDFTFDEETEIGLEVIPAQGLHQPKWDGTEWVEGLSEEEIDELTKPQPQEPTIEERLQMAEDTIMFVLMGGM